MSGPGLLVVSIIFEKHYRNNTIFGLLSYCIGKIFSNFKNKLSFMYYVLWKYYTYL